MKFILVTICLISSNLLFALSQQFVPPPNLTLDSIFKNLPPERAKYLPFYLIKFDPIQLNKMSREEVLDVFGKQFTKFIIDSGWKYINSFQPSFTYNGNVIFTPELLLSLKRVGHPKVSPDGNYLLYSVGTPNIKENKIITNLFLINLEDNSIEQLTDDPNQKSDYQWFPDSRKIAFIYTKDGKSEVYSLEIKTKEMKQITATENGVNAFKISPDGNWIAYATDVKIFQTPQEKYPFLNKAKVRMYTKLPVRHWDEWEDEKYSHLFIQPINGGQPIDLMNGEPYDCPDKPFGGSEQFAWSPDSKEIAYTCKKVDNYAQSTNTDIFLFNLDNRRTINITDGMLGYDKNPQYSPNGQWIAFHSMARSGFESDRVRLMLFNRQTKKITELSSKLDQWVGDFVWHPSSDKIYFSAEDGGTVQIYEIFLADGFWRIITTGYFNYDGGLDIHPNGNMIYFAKRNFLRPFEIFSMKTESPNPIQIQLTFENENIYQQLKVVKFEERIIKSSDKNNIHTWVLYPPEFDSTKKYPMITYCQGGPQSTVSQFFSYRWNLFLFASQGYIVVAPNRRGVPGFGQEWNDAISKDWGGKPMQDILDVTDSISKEKYVDSNRRAAVGASAGGYAVFWLEGNHNKRFSAFVSHCGVFNLESKYGSTDELWFPNWEFGGPYWESKNIHIYEKDSPHKYAQNWDTPILISTGEKDFRVPYTQSLEAFTVAQVKGIPSKLIIFPEQNHWILKPQEQILWYYEVFEFLDKYCKSKK